jgi:hypothetical protein
MRGRAALPNKELKLTKPGQIGASQLNSSVLRTSERETMRVLTMVILASSGAIQPPDAAVSALRGAYPEFAKSSLQQVVAVDADADGQKDWVGVARDERRWAILIAYAKRGGWRAANIDMGEAPGPDRLEALAPGAYARQARCTGMLGPNERASFTSSLSGVVASGFGGTRRAYQLGQHAWGYVCVGRETP